MLAIGFIWGENTKLVYVITFMGILLLETINY
jgi:hypothetical protein